MEFDELVEHLDDLILLAYNEGFSLMATALSGSRARFVDRRILYGERTSADRQVITAGEVGELDVDKLGDA